MGKKKKQAAKTAAVKAKHNTAVKDSKKRIFLYAALIAVLTFAVFSNSLKNGIVKNFDDIIYTTSAASTKTLDAEALGTIFTSYVAGIYHPVTMLSLSMENKLFGDGAMHYHLINLFFHVLNVLLVFWFIRLLTKRIEMAVIVSLFFGIHPMHVESVSWISERKDVLFTFFFLCSLITYLKYTQDAKKYGYLIFSLLLFLFSVLSKSTAVCLAPLVVLIDYYLKRKFTSGVIYEKVPYFLFSIVFGMIAIMSQKAAGATAALGNLHFDYSFSDRIFMICYSVMFYIVKAVAPFNLSAIHYYPLKTGGILPIIYYLSPLGIGIIFFLIMKLRKIRKDLVFGFLFYLITIFLVLQFIPVGFAVVSERYSYIPYIGLFFITGKLYCDFSDNEFSNYSKKMKRLSIIGITLSGILFSALSFERNKVWKNDITLFSDVIKENPEAGHAYWARGCGKYEMKDYPGAIKDFNDAIINNYTFADVYNSRGKCYLQTDSLNAALSDYTKAIGIDSSFALAYYNRAHVKQVLKDYTGSIDDYRKAIENNIQNIGFVYNEMSYSQYQVKDYQNALASTNKAIELDPENASSYKQNKARIEKAMNL